MKSSSVLFRFSDARNPLVRGGSILNCSNNKEVEVLIEIEVSAVMCLFFSRGSLELELLDLFGGSIFVVCRWEICMFEGGVNKAYGKISNMPAGTYLEKEFWGGGSFEGGWLISKFGILIKVWYSHRK